MSNSADALASLGWSESAREGKVRVHQMRVALADAQPLARVLLDEDGEPARLFDVLLASALTGILARVPRDAHWEEKCSAPGSAVSLAWRIAEEAEDYRRSMLGRKARVRR